MSAAFPVDDVTLSALEHALGGSYTVDEDGTHHLVGAEYDLSGLLDFLAGYDPAKTAPMLDSDGYEIPDVVEYTGGPLYHEHDVIAALVAEVRRLRAQPEPVCEGWWHPNVKDGQVHDHPEQPGRSWSAASHRLCEQVFTHRAKGKRHDG